MDRCPQNDLLIYSSPGRAPGITGRLWPGLCLNVQVWVSPWCGSWLTQRSTSLQPGTPAHAAFCQRAPGSLTSGIREAFPPPVVSWPSPCAVMVSPGLRERGDSVIHDPGLGNSAHGQEVFRGPRFACLSVRATETRHVFGIAQGPMLSI